MNKQIQRLHALVTSGSEGKILAASGGLMAAGAVVATLGMLAVGIPLAASAQPAPEPEPIQAQLPVVSARTTPASLLVDQLLKQPAKGWKATGGRIEGATAPFPYTCPVTGGAPVMATSQPYQTGQGKATLTVSVYGPGIGAKAAKQLSDGARSCAKGTGYTSQWLSGDREWTASSTLSGNSSRTTMVRRGDVIIHVSGSGASNTQSLAGQVAKTLDGALTKDVCADPKSALDEVDRNPLSSNYAPHRIPTKAEIPDPGMPVVPAGESWDQASLINPLKQIDAAVVAERPTWPVWPEMPEALPLPVAPQLPAAEPVLSTTLQALARDSQGPGCGWAFTGTPESVFDQAQAEQSNAAGVAAAKQELATGAGTWASDVLAYWRDASAYKAATEKYDKYVDEVADVNAAWSVIDGQWAIYNTELAHYTERESEIDRFNATQTAARDGYNTELAQCQATQAEQLEHNRQVALAPPVADPSLPVEPVAPLDPLDPLTPPVTPEDPAPLEMVEVVDCSEIERPSILDQVAPVSLPAPIQPADPRPAAEEAPSAG